MNATRIIYIIFVLSVVAVGFGYGQQNRKPDGKVFTAKLFVEHVPKSAFAPDVEPMEDSYSVITYIASGANFADLHETVVKIAHMGRSADKLKVGDEICANVQYTARFREFAADVFNDFGIAVPEALLADFIYVGPSTECR